MTDRERETYRNLAAEAEVTRIKAALAPSDGDKEDLMTYAKDVVRLRAMAVNRSADA